MGFGMRVSPCLTVTASAHSRSATATASSDCFSRSFLAVCGRRFDEYFEYLGRRLQYLDFVVAVSKADFGIAQGHPASLEFGLHCVHLASVRGCSALQLLQLLFQSLHSCFQRSYVLLGLLFWRSGGRM